MPVDQWIDLGYENHNSLLNLGSLAIFAYLYVFRVVYYFGVYIVVQKTKRGEEYLKKLGDQLFYGEILAILMDAYFEFLIAGYLQFKAPLNTRNGEYLGTVTAGVALLLVLVVVPLCFVYILTRTPLD